MIDNMSGEGDPEKYRDEYREALEQVMDEKIEHPEKDLPKKAAPERSPKVIGLVAVPRNRRAARRRIEPA